MNILLVDDHALFAKSLAIALEDFEEIESLSVAAGPEGLLARLEKERPDILLLDIHLGKGQEDGLLLTGEVLRAFPDQKVVILSGYDLPVYRKEAKRLGAAGFVGKEVEPEELVKILKSVNRGNKSFRGGEVFLEELTGAEREILERTARGERRREIARQLFLSERTVSNHLQHIFEKLEVSSALEAVSKAIALGYLRPDFSDTPCSFSQKCDKLRGKKTKDVK